MRRRVVFAVALIAATAGARAADERALLNHCKALVARVHVASAGDAEVQHCRQVIKEWTLRDSRMSVDENGRPLR